MTRIGFLSRCAFILAAWGLGGGITNARADDWTGRDKALHFAVGAGIGGAVTAATGEPLTGFAIGTAVGFAKEISDAQNRANHTPSTKDLIATAAGAAVGAWASGVVIRRDYVGFERSVSLDAIEPPEDEAAGNGLWVNVGGFSKHFQDRGRNETNLGLGVEYRFRDDVSVMAGYHENSLRLRTRYAAVNYQPLQVGPLKVGASVGFMTGYPAMNDGGAFFAALPMLTWEGKTFGANFGVIPNIPSKHVEGAIVLQLKFRAF